MPREGGEMDVAVTRGLAGAASVWLAALVAAAWVTEAGAAPAPAAATGQVDQATTVRGQLRGDLLAASLPGGTGPYPDPAHAIVVRSSLRVAGTRALLVAFRSLGGRACLGISLAGARAPATPPRCLPPCRAAVCLVLYRGGPLPRDTRILAGRAEPGIDEIRVASPSGAVRRYRVSRTRIGAPPAAPILARVATVRRVGAFAAGRELAWVRFPEE